MWNRGQAGRRLGVVFSILLFIIVTGQGEPLSSHDPLDNWKLVHQFPVPLTTNVPPLFTITYGNGFYVAAGPGGLIVNSTDGTNWIPQIAATSATSEWTGSAFGNGNFVIAGGTGLLTSTNGSNWVFQAQAEGVSADGSRFVTAINGVKFVNEQFMAFGHQSHRTGPKGVILISNDAEQWIEISIPDIERVNGVAFGNGVYVAIANKGGFSRILTSADGKNWILRNLQSTRILRDIVFGNGLFAAVGDQGRLITSPNGIEWSFPASGTDTDIASVIYENGLFVAVGGHITASGVPLNNVSRFNVILTSSNGVSWTKKIPHTPISFTDVVFGAGRFVAVSSDPYPLGPSIGAFAVSENGSQWWNPQAPTDLYSVAFGNGKFITVAANGIILNSEDGTSWTAAQDTLNTPLYDVTFGNGVFVAAGLGGMILTSTNGINWTQQDSHTAITIRTVLFANNSFVAIGGETSAGVTLFSTDGIDWTASQSATLKLYNDVAYGDGLYLSTGYNVSGSMGIHTNWVLQSVDGRKWELSPMRGFVMRTTYPRIIFGNGNFLTYGTDNVSILGRTKEQPDWTLRRTELDGFTGLAFGNDTFLGLGKGFVVSSHDSVNWSKHVTGHTIALNDAVFAKGIFVAVGSNGTILQSGRVASDNRSGFKNSRINGASFQTIISIESGKQFILEAADSLQGSPWVPLRTIMGTDAEVSFADTNAISKQRFYRLVPQQ